jgi:hypothetical protein
MLCFDASQAMRLRDVDDLFWPTAAVRKRSRPSLTVITAAAPRCRFSGGVEVEAERSVSDRI